MTKNKRDKNNDSYEKLIKIKDEARTIRKIVAIICLVIVLLIGGAGLATYLYIQSAIKPLDPKHRKTTTVEVPIGSTVSTIGSTLKDKGIIKSELVFKYYVKLNNETGFQAGTYKLSPSMDLDQIIKNLKTGKVLKEAKLKFTIPEGLQITQIVDIIAKQTKYNKNDILQKMDNEKYLNSLIKAYPNLLSKEILDKRIKHPLEGYLFPATYSFYDDKPSIDKIINKMVLKTNDVVEKYQNQITKKNLNVHELLTMASLIEEEATEKADRHKISSIFYNRMKVGMPLQTDPTILYSLQKHKDRVSYEDLKVDSPYNTYVNTGLPPSPIASAGESSIEAAINPEKTDYLYFLAAKKTGKVYYSKTLTEHNQLKEKYITSVN